MMLHGQNLVVAYDSHTVIRDLSHQIPQGKISVFIGTNGCGKSTLLKALARQIQPTGGQIVLDGKAVNEYGSKAFARRLAMLPQSPATPEGISVRQLVRYGRYPHRTFGKAWQPGDDAAVENAMHLTRTDAFAEQAVKTLSGGQRQRAWIAMALAQDTPYLLLDEPTTFLDLSYQIEILDLLQQLNRETGKTILMVLHDLNLACRYADEIVALYQGNVHARGTPQEVMTAETVQTVFGLKSMMIADPIYGTPMCIPFGRESFKSFENGHTVE
ncbi:hypothetical protein CGZ65_03855 [Neisseria weixii]|nr:hypothetical protein CGZ65_03855 [Neisseria weixii]